MLLILINVIDSYFASFVQSNGDFLQAVDEHDLHVLRVWDWQNEKLIAQTTVSV